MKLMKRRKGVAVLIPVTHHEHYIAAGLDDADSQPGSLVGGSAASLVVTGRS